MTERFDLASYKMKTNQLMFQDSSVLGLILSVKAFDLAASAQLAALSSNRLLHVIRCFEDPKLSQLRKGRNGELSPE